MLIVVITVVVWFVGWCWVCVLDVFGWVLWVVVLGYVYFDWLL